MARKHIIAGNWKMNLVASDADRLVRDVVDGLQSNSPEGVTVVMGTPAVYVRSTAKLIGEATDVYVAAQNCSMHKSGAFTGEIAADMVKSVGAEFVILGHSERREYFAETNVMLAEKVNRALENDLSPIYCCGESLEQRKEGVHYKFIEDQIVAGLFHLSAEDLKKCVIAYEPIWAIGTGETASPEQAQEIHAFIRKLISESYGQEVSEEISILYGGSMKPGNAKELLACEDIDGGLIGGASLKAADFLQIAHSY